MTLTKLYEVVNTKDPNEVFRTYRTEQECLNYLESNDLADYMSDLTLTIRPVWTTKSEAKIKRLLREE